MMALHYEPRTHTGDYKSIGLMGELEEGSGDHCNQQARHHVMKIHLLSNCTGSQATTKVNQIHPLGSALLSRRCQVRQ